MARVNIVSVKTFRHPKNFGGVTHGVCENRDAVEAAAGRNHAAGNVPFGLPINIMPAAKGRSDQLASRFFFFFVFFFFPSSPPFSAATAWETIAGRRNDGSHDQRLQKTATILPNVDENLFKVNQKLCSHGSTPPLGYRYAYCTLHSRMNSRKKVTISRQNKKGQSRYPDFQEDRREPQLPRVFSL